MTDKSATNSYGSAMTVVSFGGGVNSTAMLIGMVERGETCDLVLFADTGAEKPHTYAHVLEFSEYLVAHGMPPITTVSNDLPSRYGGLEAYALHHKTLPSIAFGFKTCSRVFKIDPQEMFLKEHPLAKTVWQSGDKILKLVGYDADEPHRAAKAPPVNSKQDYKYRYPLIEWNWGREECVEAIARAGVTQPGKSACFFCPSSKKKEIYELRRVYPDLAKRAVAMEQGAELITVKGLGRSFAWGDLYAADDAQDKLFPESPIEIDCGCYDGGTE
jgi:hypothetical protein